MGTIAPKSIGKLKARASGATDGKDDRFTPGLELHFAGFGLLMNKTPSKPFPSLGALGRRWLLSRAHLPGPSRHARQAVKLGAWPHAAEMRDMGVRGLLIYCSDYHCSHSIAISADRWPDDVRLFDLEPRLVCQACGKRGADVRPDFNWNNR
jgi:hypothetical protein